MFMMGNKAKDAKRAEFNSAKNYFPAIFCPSELCESEGDSAQFFWRAERLKVKNKLPVDLLALILKCEWQKINL